MTDETRNFQKVYWFARSLIDSENGGIGNNSAKLLQLAKAIEISLAPTDFDISAAKSGIFTILRRFRKKGTKAAGKIEELIKEIDSLLQSKGDLVVLQFTIEHILVPTNTLMREIPSSDKSMVIDQIEAHLQTKGESGLPDVIEMWDKAGRIGSMKAERTVIVAGFRILRELVSEMMADGQINHIDSDEILTAFVQEFERRLSRGLRPKRAGRSLEDVTGVILNHFGVENFTDAPEHIKTSFEVDKLIMLPNGKRIGVSCKRTLRERWKQAATLNLESLDREKIQSTLHVLTFTGDLSKKKVIAIGDSRGVVYVPDHSSFFQANRSDPDLVKSLRPLSQFIQDLKKAHIIS